MIRNLLALIGLIVLIAVGYVGVRHLDWIYTVRDFDPRALQTYGDIARSLMESGNAIEATVWKMPVAEGLSAEAVEQTMKFVANEHNIKDVGELPLYQQVQAMTGQPYRFVKIYMFCNALTAARMIDFHPAYSAWLPCRVTLVEDAQQQLWLYTSNMDLMIYGGRPLPAALKQEAEQVKETILDIMRRGAKGEF